MEEINRIRLKLAKANNANENTNNSGKDYMTIRDSLTDIALLLCRVERAVGECSHKNSGLNMPVVMPSTLPEPQQWFMDKYNVTPSRMNLIVHKGNDVVSFIHKCLDELP